MRELKSVVLIVLVLTATLRADDTEVIVPLVKSKFIYSSSKQIKEYIKNRLTTEMEQLNNEKKKLKGRARKRVVIRSKRLKRELVFYKNKNILPASLKKSLSQPGIGFVNHSDLKWVTVIRVINPREFTATLGYQRVTIKQIGNQRAFRSSRVNIEGFTPFSFRGFDTSKLEVDHAYRLVGFLKTTGNLVEPFVPDATGSPQGKQPKRKKTKHGRGKGRRQN